MLRRGPTGLVLATFTPPTVLASVQSDFAEPNFEYAEFPSSRGTSSVARDRGGRGPLRHLQRSVPTCKPSGGTTPVRLHFVGCDHYRTTVAHLPDLQAYLDDLLRTRERLAALPDCSICGGNRRRGPASRPRSAIEHLE